MTRPLFVWICSLACAMLLTLVFTGCDPEEAPAPPSTDIHLASYTVSGDTIALETPANRTERAGYDNQPHFTHDGDALLYTSQRDGQTDIYRWPLDEEDPHPLTATETSEYSPTPINDSTYTVVRVEPDGAQRLWAFPLVGDALPAIDGTLLLPEVEPVGYFAWADADQVALFVLGDPPTLQWASRTTSTADTVRADIGRSLETRPHADGISAVQRHTDTSDSLLVVRSPDDISPYAPALDSEGDHTWTRDGHLLMTAGTALYQWHESSAMWREVYDWDPATPSRLAASPTENKLAIVVEPPTDNE